MYALQSSNIRKPFTKLVLIFSNISFSPWQMIRLAPLYRLIRSGKLRCTKGISSHSFSCGVTMSVRRPLARALRSILRRTEVFPVPGFPTNTILNTSRVGSSSFGLFGCCFSCCFGSFVSSDSCDFIL